MNGNGIGWTEPAMADLEALHAFLARDSKPLADEVVNRLMTSIERVIPFPRIGRVVTEIGDESVRELLFRTFRIVYRSTPEGIVVLSILHGGRTSERREPRRWEIY